MIDRSALTTPQRRILEAIENATQPMGACDIKVASKSYTIATVRKFHENGLIHIADWKPNGQNHYARYRPGPGKDAERPKASREELLRRKRERQRAHMAEKRADWRSAPACPPALPTHTPRLGLWGI